MKWKVRTLDDIVEREILALPSDMQQRLNQLIAVVEAVGVLGLPPKAVKHLEDKLWELRITGRDGIARAIYLMMAGPQFVILRVFVKKTQKTPPQELALARRRARDAK